VNFFLDEIHWMNGHGITDEATYVDGKTSRIGRGKPLAPQDRAIVFEVYQRYLELRAQSGYEYDWDDMASATLTALRDDATQRLYRHIVVDEGQDFTPQMIRSLAAAVPPDGSLTFFGDYAQQIYGSRLSWSSLGLNVAGTVPFSQNYRNSRQIVQLAKAISDMPYFRDEVDLVQPQALRADAAKPTILRVADRSAQLRRAAEIANGLATNSQVAVLMPTRAHESGLLKLLGSRHKISRLHRDLTLWPQGPGIFYGTYSAAKGLEFDSVILPFCDAEELPRLGEVEAHGLEEAMAREGRQLYVAVTRARTNLALLHSSRLTNLLPDASSDLFHGVPA